MVADKYKSNEQKGAIEMVRYAGQVINEFLNDKGMKSENTKRAYTKDIVEFISDFFNTDITHVTYDQLKVLNYDLLKKYRDNLYAATNEEGKRVNSNGTINRKLSTIRSLYSNLVAREKIEVNLEGLRSVEKLDDDSKRVAYISVEDSLRIADWLGKNEKHNGYEKKMIVFMLIETGNRIKEILDLKWSDIENISGKIFIKGRGKGNKEFNEVLPDKLFELLLKIKKDGQDEIFSVKYTTMYKSIKRALQELKVESGGTLHSFKRTALTYVSNSTGDIQAVQLKGKHSSLDMPLRYRKESEAHANGVFTGTYGVDKELYKKVDHSVLLEALGNMKGEYQMLLNAELNRILTK